MTERDNALTRRPSFVCVVADGGKAADGVRDHAYQLAARLQDHGVAATVIPIPWIDSSLAARIGHLRDASRTSPDRIVLHYSHLAWSRRGMPFGFLAIVAWFRLCAPVTLWLHDPGPVAPGRMRYRIASAVKGLALNLAVRVAGTGVASVNPAALGWATRSIRRRLVLCPSPSNVGARARTPPEDLFTVTCFGQGVGTTQREQGPMGNVARSLTERIGPFRFRLLGALDERPRLVADLERLGVTCDAPGFLDSDSLRDRLAASHAFLMVRSGLTTRSGTLGAALACGLPVVGMSGPETAPPITDAGVILVADGDWEAMADALARLARDPTLQEELSRKSEAVAREHYSWDVACERLLDLVGATRPA